MGVARDRYIDAVRRQREQEKARRAVVVEPKPDERHYTPQEIADILQISPDTVRRIFSGLPGVLMIPAGKRRTIRVPDSVFQAWHRSRVA